MSSFPRPPRESARPAADFLRPRLQRRATDDQPRADVGDAFNLDEPIRLQCCAGLNKVDDVAAQTEPRRQLDRPIKLDAFGLNTARGKMAAGDFGYFVAIRIWLSRVSSRSATQSAGAATAIRQCPILRSSGA